jgi:hypothetical protein
MMASQSRSMLKRAVADLRQISREVRTSPVESDTLSVRAEAALRYYQSALSRPERGKVPSIADRVGLAAFGGTCTGLFPRL